MFYQYIQRMKNEKENFKKLNLKKDPHGKKNLYLKNEFFSTGMTGKVVRVSRDKQYHSAFTLPCK